MIVYLFFKFTLNNIVVQQINADNTLDQKITSIKAVSIQGGSGGKQLESKEEIRRKLVQPEGKYIGSMSDIRNEFFLDNGEPYIDKKYFAGTAHQKTGRKFFGGKRNPNFIILCNFLF